MMTVGIKMNQINYWTRLEGTLNTRTSGVQVLQIQQKLVLPTRISQQTSPPQGVKTGLTFPQQMSWFPLEGKHSQNQACLWPAFTPRLTPYLPWLLEPWLCKHPSQIISCRGAPNQFRKWQGRQGTKKRRNSAVEPRPSQQTGVRNLY